MGYEPSRTLGARTGRVFKPRVKQIRNAEQPAQKLRRGRRQHARPRRFVRWRAIIRRTHLDVTEGNPARSSLKPNRWTSYTDSTFAGLWLRGLRCPPRCTDTFLQPGSGFLGDFPRNSRVRPAHPENFHRTWNETGGDTHVLLVSLTYFSWTIDSRFLRIANSGLVPLWDPKGYLACAFVLVLVGET